MKGYNNEELIGRLQRDEIEAFNFLYWAYHSAIYYNVLKLTRDLVIAEDIVQEVFITLWEKRHSLDASQEVSGWLFVVSYNKSVNYLKKKLKESLVQTTLQSSLSDKTELDENLVNARETILEKAIEQLSPQKRKVFELCKLNGKTYEEAANEMKLSKHTVKEYLSSAIVSIKEFIKQHPAYTVVFTCAIMILKYFKDRHLGAV